MRRPIIGHGAKAVGGIPVERPQDLAKPGKGIILCYEKGNLIVKKKKIFKFI